MNREDIIAMAHESALDVYGLGTDYAKFSDALERFDALAAAAERNKLAAWMIQFGFATGHGDSMEQLLDALGTEIVDRIDAELDAEREACAKFVESLEGCSQYFPHVPDAIRARGQS